MRYIKPTPPQQYSVRKVFYSCNSCGKSFSVLQPYGNDVVKYVATDGEDERWLPTYGEGGYLYLMERLLPDFMQNQEITMAISRRFERVFSPLQKMSKNGLPFVLFIRARCSACGSTDLRTEKESLLNSPPLEWMEYRLEVR